MSDRCTLLQQINEISFVVNDLNLYLDTHPTDTSALEEFSRRWHREGSFWTRLQRNMNPLP